MQVHLNSNYPIAGINDIIRFHLFRFMQKADNPGEALYALNEKDAAVEIYGEKVYYVNMIMQLQFEDQAHYKRFRVAFT